MRATARSGVPVPARAPVRAPVRSLVRALALVLVLPGCNAGGVSGVQRPELTLGGIGIACQTRGGGLGREVAQFPPEGRARWRIYDTAPDRTGPRTHYVTGFSDSCARAVQASLVLFGSPRVYDAMRAGGAGRAVTEVDTAYGRIKRRVCGVAAASPCPSDRIDRLEARTVFVTIYPNFGGGPGGELLLDDGEIVARAGL